jgi:hypothetical protein
LKIMAEYQLIATELGPERCARPARVPALPGVDEDMREWSLAMILEHNTLVNRSITEITRCLAQNEVPSGPVGDPNPKTDFNPSPDADAGQMESFKKSVLDHFHTVAQLPSLRGTPTKEHPVFGPLDAHGWHAMFRLHLQLHLRQAQALQKALKFR